MIIVSKIYIFMYFFYSYFGYNCVYRITCNKNIDYALLNKNAYSFIGRRLCMLSHLTLLYSSYFLEYPSNNRYINTLGLHIIVNCGYYNIWGLTEITTFLMHLFWSLPVIIYKNIYYNNIQISIYNYNLSNENLLLICFLLLYSQSFKYIYISRLKNIDKEE